MNIEDHGELLRYLRRNGHIPADESPGFVTLRGGVSNRTVWLRRERGGDWVIKQALPKLRVPVDWFSAPERIEREAAALRWLGKIAPGQAPEFVFADDSRHILAMTAIPQPHDNWKTLLLAGRTDQGLARAFGHLLSRIHNAVADYPALARDFAERRFFEELRLEPYYAYSASQMPGARSFLDQLIHDTRQRRLALVHGDYSPKNALIHRGNLIILDFEVMHFGDPAFDLGFSLTHILSKAHHLPACRAALLDMARVYWRSYHDTRRGIDPGDLNAVAVRHTLGCLLARVAGRSQLEYFDEAQRRRQAAITLDLMKQNIGAPDDLIDAFAAGLGGSDEPH